MKHGMTLKNVEFSSEGLVLRGRFVTTSDSPNHEPLVVIASGDGKSGSKSSSYDIIIPKLLDIGVSVFVFDFAGQGFSDGDHSRLTIQTGINNLQSAMKVVEAESWIDRSRIGIIGSSFGGNVTLNFAGNYKNDIKVMCLKSPACLYPEVYENIIGEDGIRKWRSNGYSEKLNRHWETYCEGFQHNTYSSAGKLTLPCLITHGTADTIVPIVHSYRLKACMRGEVDLNILDGVDHGYTNNDSLSTAAQLYADWFANKL